MRKVEEGAVFSTNQSGPIRVVKFLTSSSVDVVFLNTGNTKRTRSHFIRIGRVYDDKKCNAPLASVYDKMFNLVMGVK